MKEKQVEIGIIYNATSVLLSQPFKGEVLRKWVNGAVLLITDHSPQDELSVYQLNGRIVVNYRDLAIQGDCE